MVKPLFVMGRWLIASAIAFTVARLTTWIWTDWYLHVQGIPPLERLPDPYLRSTASAMFGGLFLVVLLVSLWRMRRRALQSQLARVRAPSESATPSSSQFAWHHRLVAQIGNALTAFCLAYASTELTARIYVWWYALDTGIAAHELANDLGLGITLFMVCAPVFVVALITAWTWLYLTRRASRLARGRRIT